MPKRKQKLPRRTRRHSSLTPADNEETLANSYTTEECQSNAKENPVLPINNFRDTTEIGRTAHEMKECNYRNMDNLKNVFHTENGSLNYSKIMVKKDQESEISSKGCIENCTKHSRESNNPSENFNLLKRNLKRPLDNVMLSVDVSKRPAAFVNFRNESEDGNMPVILNVFTLCQAPVSHTKQKTTNILRENSFPVTPPSSPPLLKLEKVRTQFPSRNGFTMPAIHESTIESNVCNNTCTPVEHHRQNITNWVQPVFPTAINQFVNERNYTVQNHVVQPSLSSNRRFVPPENKQFQRFSDEERRRISEPNKSPKQSSFSELRQLVQRNLFLKNQSSNIMNYEPKNAVEQSKLNRLSGSSKSNSILSDGLEAAFRGDRMGHIQHLDLSPEAAITAKTSCTAAQSVNDHENPVNVSNIFLSPRDVKVLHLKKKIQEQEEALKKLRTTH